jgi:hypothetical protein
MESLVEGVRNQHIDQKLHYLSADAALKWRAVIDTQSYKTYEQCKHALAALTQTPFWKTHIGSPNMDGAVVLGGGGAPEKDMVLINSLLNSTAGKSARVHYVLVDVSFYMLVYSYRFLDSVLRKQGARKRVALEMVVCDIMDLRGARNQLRRNGKNVTWFIPGGTLGNLNESQFFRSIEYKSEADDLLVVGAECFSEESRDKLRSELETQYDMSDDAIRNFATAPLRSSWHDLGVEESLDEVVKKIELRILSGDDNVYSQVPGAITIEGSVKIDGSKVVLFTSSRYTEDGLLKIASGRGFKHETSVESPLNKNFKQLVFRRTASAPTRR